MIAALIFFAACTVLFGIGFFAVLVGASQQTDDLRRRIDWRDARIEDLANEVRWLRRRNHPAGRALPHLALAEALTERDAEHEGGAGA